MNFCIISPIEGLERYATLSKTHLVLAQIKDKRYREFYLNCRSLGDTLILDNGAYEQGEHISTEEFVDAACYYRAQWVVCPDKPFTPWQDTYSRVSGFLDRYHSALRNMGCRFIGIPHTTEGNLLGWIQGLLTMVNDFPLDGVGIPRCLATHYWPEDPLIRVKAVEFIKQYWRKEKLYTHAMGMVNGSVDELNALREVGVDSCDSSAPVNRGLFNLSLTDPKDRQFWDEHGDACRIDQVLPDGNYDWDKRVRENLEACGVNTNRNGNR